MLLVVVIQWQFLHFPDVLLCCGEHPPEQQNEENKEDKQGDHGVICHPVDGLHMVLYKFQHGFIVFWKQESRHRT